ncbi:VQ motif-containing protein [Wolffia australiana]
MEKGVLRQLHRSSHKIAKPNSRPNNAGGGPAVNDDDCGGGGATAAAQPPVYNINKNDFREVVQKLTGSPLHQAREGNIPGNIPGKIPGNIPTRLHKIRPPPLAVDPAAQSGGGGFAAWPKSAPLSPLPPLPTVSSAAESPISAYMRCLRSEPAGPPSPLGLGCLPSPRSAYHMMISSGLISPSSPSLPLPSPRLKDHQ